MSGNKKEHENARSPNHQGKADAPTASLDQDKKQEAPCRTFPHGPPMSPYAYPYHYHQPFMSPLPYDHSAIPNDATAPSHSKTSEGESPPNSPPPSLYYHPYPYYGGYPPPPPQLQPTLGEELTSGATAITPSEQRAEGEKDDSVEKVGPHKNAQDEKPKSDEVASTPDFQHQSLHGAGYPPPPPGGYYHHYPPPLPPYYYPPPYGHYPCQYPPPPGHYSPPYGGDPARQPGHYNSAGAAPPPTVPVAPSRADKTVPKQVSKSDNDDTNASDGVLPIYVRSNVVTKEILERRRRKNSSARAHEAQKRERVAQILQKPEHERTHEEISLVEKVFRSREHKNSRSRERALEVKAKMDAILEKPPEERTDHEIQFLEIHMKRRKRKYEGDHLRRQRYKSLGFSARSKAKLGLNARGPMPADLQEKIEEHIEESGGTIPAALVTSHLTPHAYPRPMMHYYHPPP